MEAYYWTQFSVLAIFCALMEFQKFTQKEKTQMPSSFLNFRNNYLFVYSLTSTARRERVVDVGGEDDQDGDENEWEE